MPGEQLVRIAGRRLKVTNLDKVLYPETGTTKGDVIDYYTRIAPLLLAHAAGRPVTRKRWVEGVGTAEHPENAFFAKDLERGAPSWLPRHPIEHSTGAKDYPLVDEVAALVYLAQVASLELHVPQWRFDAAGGRARPDRLVLDLDPGPGVGLAECAEVARYAKAVLDGMGMDAMPVTSGSKGIHLYAKLHGEQTSDQATAFAKELARALEADHPGLVVSTMSRSDRSGRVFIDWSQNNGSKTTIAPYSLRGRPRPFVAAPRTWEELDDPQLCHLELGDVLERAERIGDPLTALATATDPLGTYIAKRTAGRTPEPVPQTPAVAMPASGDAPRFVIQEHHASRLHWDLRLERDGVLASWAVPRGVPPTSTRNNLAVHTEDHPLEYLDFAGDIPQGEYGAGTMTVWDTGTYELEKWRDDEVIFTLTGRPEGPLGTVRLALIRTDGSGEKSSWLLHRMKTDAEGHRQPDGPIVAPTNPTPPDPEPAPLPEPDAVPEPVEGHVAGPPRPMLAAAGTPGLAHGMAREALERGHRPWVEFKWDGVRALGVWQGGMLRLYARSGTDITERYPELTDDDATRFAASDAVFDGELVALDTRGRPSFTRLQHRMHLTKRTEIAREARRTPVLLYLFDVLEAEGRDVSGLPLADRREILERIAAGAGAAVMIPPVFDDVDAALGAAEEHGLEGVVVKDPASRYRRGSRSESWLKVKLTRMQEVVIGAIRPGRGNRAGSIGSLLLGVPGADGLEYAGRVGTGFSDHTLRSLSEKLEPLRTNENPFTDIPDADAADALWVRPRLVGEVEFAEWSPGGILRHSRWRGLRPDKTPDQVRREP